MNSKCLSSLNSKLGRLSKSTKNERIIRIGQNMIVEIKLIMFYPLYYSLLLFMRMKMELKTALKYRSGKIGMDNTTAMTQ